MIMTAPRRGLCSGPDCLQKYSLLCHETPIPWAARRALFCMATTRIAGDFWMTAERVGRRLASVLAASVAGYPGGGRIAAPLKRLIYMWVAAVVVFLVSVGGTAAQPKSGETAVQPKKILLLHTFGPNFEQGAAWSREIQRELNKQSPWPLNIQEQSLVTAVDGDDTAEAKFGEYLKALYAQRPPDLIVALGAPAARFVQQHRPDLYPTTPMLLAAVEVRRVEPSMLSEQDAVAGVRYDDVAAMENILRLLPKRNPSRSS